MRKKRNEATGTCTPRLNGTRFAAIARSYGPRSVSPITYTIRYVQRIVSDPPIPKIGGWGRAHFVNCHESSVVAGSFLELPHNLCVRVCTHRPEKNGHIVRTKCVVLWHVDTKVRKRKRAKNCIDTGI